jgi:hypothetical protein
LGNQNHKNPPPQNLLSAARASSPNNTTQLCDEGERSTIFGISDFPPPNWVQRHAGGFKPFFFSRLFYSSAFKSAP